MIVVMDHGATEEQVNHVIELLEEIDLKTHIIHGTDRTVVAAIGDKRMLDKGALENAPGVEKIVPILAPYKVASKEVHRKIGSRIAKICDFAIITTKDYFEEVKQERKNIVLIEKLEEIIKEIKKYPNSTVLLEGRIPKEIKENLCQ